MTERSKSADTIFEEFLAGLVALDEDGKNTPRKESTNGIHFWQLQQYIEELADELIQFESQFDELGHKWTTHEKYWGRYLGPAAIQFAKNLVADPEYTDEEFSIDWFDRFEEIGE